MLKQALAVLSALFAALLLVGGCSGVVTEGADPPPPHPVPTVPILAVGIATSAPVAPIPTAHTSGRATVTAGISSAHGDSPEAVSIVEKWKQAIRELKWVSGEQYIMQINADGTREPPLELGYPRLLGTDERWDLTDKVGQRWRYRFMAHTKQGYVLIVFDGTADYVLWSSAKEELHRLLPETRSRTALLKQEVIDASFVSFLRPKDTIYSFVGKSILNGHSVIELRAPFPGHGSNRLTSMHVYLDAERYLPYRLVLDPSEGSYGREYTIEDLKVNEPIPDQEFRDGLPSLDHVVTIYHPQDEASKLPTYASLRDKDLKPGFTLFEPQNGTKGEIVTVALVEKGGKRTPILSVNGGKLLEGTYLPTIMGNVRFFSDSPEGPLGTTIDVSGQPATIYPDGEAVRLRFQRAGTWIEIRAQTSHEAIREAQSLRPIR